MKTIVVATKTVNAVGKNGRPLQLVKGQQLKKNQIVNLQSRHKSYVEEQVVANTPKTRMSLDEKLLIADLYNDLSDPVNQSDNRTDIISKFYEVYPNRPEASIIFYICQCKHIDLFYNSTGFTSVDKNIIKFLHGLNPDRYISIEDYEYAQSYA